MTAVDKVLKKVETLQTLVLRTQDIITRWDATVTISEIKLTLTELEAYRIEILQLYRNLSDLTTSDELKAHDPTFHTIFNRVRKLQIDSNELLVKKESAAKAKVSPSFKLDRIKLPQFQGAISEWQSFYDLFLSFVDKNPTLSGAEKLIHLKSCLGGEAAAIVGTYKATDANYKQAWDSVVKRYSNKREIVFAHIRKLDDLKSSSDESASGIRSVSDTINECTRSMTSLGVPVEHWDLILIFFALKKLSSETKKQWLLDEKAALPTLANFIEYLEVRARALADSEGSRVKKNNSGSSNSKKSSSFLSTSSSSCPQCSESHHLFRCTFFLGLTVIQRRDLVKKKQLCFNCLFPGHSVAKCRMKFSCRKCGHRHHTLLHIDLTGAPTSSGHSQVESPVDQPLVSSSHFTSSAQSEVVLLGTLQVSSLDSSGTKQTCRVFMDPGSESNFITEECVGRLGVKRRKAHVQVTSINGASAGAATGQVDLSLMSNVHDFKLNINSLILKKISDNCIKVKTYTNSVQ